MFGDKPAAAVTSVANHETASIHKDINSKAAKRSFTIPTLMTLPREQMAKRTFLSMISFTDDNII